MKKRLISLMLALALCLGLAVPALAASGYGPQTITTGDGDVLSFTSAKVEKKTVQIRLKSIPAFDGEPEIDPYQSQNITLITMKAGSDVSVSLGGIDGTDACCHLIQDGNGKYTEISKEFVMTFLTEEDLKDYIKDGAYYADAVKWAVEKGITSGTGNGQFSPGATCTRGQIVTFLHRAMG